MNEEVRNEEQTTEEPKVNGTTEEIKTEEKQGCIMNDCGLDRVAQSNYCEGHKKENEAEAQRIEEQAAKQPELPLEPPKEEEKPVEAAQPEKAPEEPKKEVEAIEKIQRREYTDFFNIPLTVEEISALEKQTLAKHDEKTETEKAAKRSAMGYKSRIQLIDEEISILRDKTKKGTEQRSVACLEEIDYSQGKAFKYRLDKEPREKISERPLSYEEKQRSLSFANQEAKKESKEPTPEVQPAQSPVAGESQEKAKEEAAKEANDQNLQAQKEAQSQESKKIVGGIIEATIKRAERKEAAQADSTIKKPAKKKAAQPKEPKDPLPLEKPTKEEKSAKGTTTTPKKKAQPKNGKK